MNTSKSPDLHTSLFKNFWLLTGGGISLIILTIVLTVWRSGNQFIHTVNSLLYPTVSNPQVDTSNLIIQQIRGVSDLTTTVFVMDAVVPTSSQRQIGNWVVGETNLLYIARGEVKAGIDLSKINQDDVSIIPNGVQIQLPPPSIIDSKIDVHNSQVYDYDRGFLNLGPDVAPQLQTEAQRQTLTKIVTTACNQGILVQANERAKILVTQLLQTSGYDNIHIEISPPEDCYQS